MRVSWAESSIPVKCRSGSVSVDVFPDGSVGGSGSITINFFDPDGVFDGSVDVSIDLNPNGSVTGSVDGSIKVTDPDDLFNGSVDGSLSW